MYKSLKFLHCGHQNIGPLPSMEALSSRRITGLTTQTDGINEKGLYAAGLWINPPPAVKYPSPDGRPALTPPMVVPYILDNYATVDAELAGFDSVRVTELVTDTIPITQHWFIADRSGDSAIIEFPDGNLSVLHPANPPVMTNHFQVWGRNWYQNYTGWGGSLPLPYREKRTSLNRFLVAIGMTEKGRAEKNLTASFVFAILGAVAQEDGIPYHYSSGSLTQWSVVYDLDNRTVEWYIHDNATRFFVTMDSIPFCTEAATRTIPLRPYRGGDVSDLMPRCEEVYQSDTKELTKK
ncbi:MAG: linear amide C-N hydrolase [Methanotrichaceae archaeon]|nr:linear amide C-N hydrolase [Methanotrichaceae archaeon]